MYYISKNHHIVIGVVCSLRKFLLLAMALTSPFTLNMLLVFN